MSIMRPIPLIQKVNEDITLTKFAPGDKYYSTLIDGKLPTAYTYPRKGSTKGDADLAICNRIYEISVFVESLGQSPTTGRATFVAGQLLDDYLERWKAIVNDDEDYVLDDGAMSGYRITLDFGKPLEDSGVSHNLMWMPDEPYVGFQIFLPIIVHWGAKLIR